MTKLFISRDLGTHSSGNIVSLNELKALESLSDVLKDTVFKLGYDKIEPTLYNLPNNPFLLDYMTMNCVANLLNKNKVNKVGVGLIDLCHLYAGPFTNTIRYLNELGIVTTLTIAAHSREESIKEFENLGIEYPFNHIKDNRLWDIYNGAIRDADVVIAPSNVSAKILRHEGAKKVEVIPHGINIKNHSIKNHSIKNHIPNPDHIIENKYKGMLKYDFTVGYMGAYGPDKGVRYLIKAWSDLNYSDSELLLGGTNATKDLDPFIRRFSTTGKYNLLGWIENIDTFYNLCSIYVQPSVTEGFGIEVLEAMSYGRPVIVSEGCGAVDAVIHGSNGFIVPKRDAEKIAAKIDWFKNHPEELNEMGKNAKNTAYNYSWDKIHEKYVELWRSLL